MTREWKIGTGAILLSACLTPAFAADDDSLVRILAKADIAHNFVVYCAQYDPSIIERTRGSVGDAQQLMLHVRSDVISGLPQAEALEVVVRSANAARIGVLLAIRERYGPTQSEESARLANWCERSAAPSVKEIVSSHDDHHDAFDAEIARAKEDLQLPNKHPSFK
ncbi:MULTISPECIES: hypothetical protein [Xanthobacteraceae]|jgi:hypothetical protein|uniref:hypothetical protein n=1 Tax=Xanthobacteraceae TaxID=335928 RepID=UPI00372A4247